MITNNSYQMTWKLRATVAMVLALAISTFPATFSRTVKAQNPDKTNAQNPAKPSSASESRGGPKEGIKVHGHWTIDVRNPDGTLVTHREFENGLGNNAALILGQFLQRSSKPGEYKIFLASNIVGEAPCTTPQVQFTSCVVYESASQSPSSQDANAFKTLTLRPGNASLGEDPAATVFTGTATAGKNGVINRVGTDFAKCPVDTVGVCASNPVFSFTTTTLATPVNVVLGQIIQVTVVITFS